LVRNTLRDLKMTTASLLCVAHDVKLTACKTEGEIARREPERERDG
jgi:hypothetical protein